jgi:hypothetical protein
MLLLHSVRSCLFAHSWLSLGTQKIRPSENDVLVELVQPQRGLLRAPQNEQFSSPARVLDFRVDLCSDKTR